MIYAVCVLTVFFIALPEMTFAQPSPADSAPPKQQASQDEKWPPNKRGATMPQCVYCPAPPESQEEGLHVGIGPFVGFGFR